MKHIDQKQQQNQLRHQPVLCRINFVFCYFSEMAYKNDTDVVATMLAVSDGPGAMEETGDNSRIICLLGGDVNLDQTQSSIIIRSREVDTPNTRFEIYEVSKVT